MLASHGSDASAVTFVTFVTFGDGRDLVIVVIRRSDNRSYGHADDQRLAVVIVVVPVVVPVVVVVLPVLPGVLGVILPIVLVLVASVLPLALVLVAGVLPLRGSRPGLLAGTGLGCLPLRRSRLTA